MAAHIRQASDKPYQFVKKQMREKKAKTSFMSQSIKMFGTDETTEFNHKWSALSMYLGGADTVSKPTNTLTLVYRKRSEVNVIAIQTVSALVTFFLAMLVYPDVQIKAREELDRVIGNERLPVSSDLKQLPYIEAIMKETQRWHPLLPMGVPHASTKEDIYRGYRIPKGAILMPNIW
jgi:hypothetical protein